MTVENATQRGHSSAAILDSVASVLKFIASELFGEGASGAGEFTSKEIGRDEILGHVPTGALTENEIKLALATLKDSGRYATIINEAVEKGERAARLKLEEIERRRLQEELAERATSVIETQHMTHNLCVSRKFYLHATRERLYWFS